MKKTLLSLSGIALLGALIAYPVFAHNTGWSGWRGHMMEPGYHMGYGNHMHDYYGGPRGGDDTTLTEDQRTKLNALHENFAAETKEIRDSLWEKRRALNALLTTPETDTEAATALQKEINVQGNTLSEKKLALELETKKIVPETGLSNFYCGGPGYGNYR